jgi:8-amino-7-oxononanoate synthase
VIDFASALYLGFRHSSEELGSWPFLTTGKPAALWEPELARSVARQAASLQRCEAGLVSPSTLHLFWDVLGWLANSRILVHLDSGVYPIAKWGAERAASLGTQVIAFRHYDGNHLEDSLRSRTDRQPVVIADGFCPACGQLAPLLDFLQCVRRHSGVLLIDDTQGLGIFGAQPSSTDPYGLGGGGSLCAAGLEREEDVICISSLAKAFGAPLAVLSGPGRLVHAFEAASQTRVHCSPPSLPALAAAASALLRNRNEGGRRRRKLASLTYALRSRLQSAIAHRGLFPVQTIVHPCADGLYQYLLSRGIQTVLPASPGGRADRLTILLTAAHTLFQVEVLSKHFEVLPEALCIA